MINEIILLSSRRNKPVRLASVDTVACVKYGRAVANVYKGRESMKKKIKQIGTIDFSNPTVSLERPQCKRSIKIH